MPNYVYNTISVQGDNNSEVLRELTEGTTICDKLNPMPPELEDTIAPSDKPNWYEWKLKNWGNKWGDIKGEYSAGIFGAGAEYDADYRFTTAWSPLNEIMLDLISKHIDEFQYSFQDEEGKGATIYFEDGKYSSTEEILDYED